MGDTSSAGVVSSGQHQDKSEEGLAPIRSTQAYCALSSGGGGGGGTQIPSSLCPDPAPTSLPLKSLGLCVLTFVFLGRGTVAPSLGQNC